MSEEFSRDPFDENLRKLLAFAAEGSQPFVESPVPAVLDAVRERRAHECRRRRKAFFVGAAAAMALIVAGIALLRRPTGGTLPAVQVRKLYGILTLGDGPEARGLENAGILRPGEWLQTHSGSEAVVTLGDGSSIAVRPRSRLQVQEAQGAARVLLQEGSVGIEVRKQPKGRTFKVETSVARVSVVGTELDVYAGKRPDCTSRTQVDVRAGLVKMEAAGQTLELPASTEGVAEDGLAPVRLAMTPEVNEMRRLIRETSTRAGKLRVEAGSPLILDFNRVGAATVWRILDVEGQPDKVTLKIAPGIAAALDRAQAFTLDGAPLPVASGGDMMQVDLSSLASGPSRMPQIILKIPEVTGLFQSAGGGRFEYRGRPSAKPLLKLLQFRLPESARVDEAAPQAFETRTELGRLILTVAAQAEGPNIFQGE
jgi:hypothetical protein